MESVYDLIIVEGKSDESFIIEYLNQRFNCSYRPFIKSKPTFENLVTLKCINKNILIKIANSKDNIITVLIDIIKSSANGIIDKIQNILILQDFDDEKYIEIYRRIEHALQNEFTINRISNGFNINSYGPYKMNFKIVIIGNGIKKFKHQNITWNHTLEDYIIFTIMQSDDPYLKSIYKEITLITVDKGIKNNYKTSIKTPVCITMAFTDSSESLSGFYKMVVSKEFLILYKILNKVYFNQKIDYFLTLT